MCSKREAVESGRLIRAATLVAAILWMLKLSSSGRSTPEKQLCGAIPCLNQEHEEIAALTVLVYSSPNIPTNTFNQLPNTKHLAIE
jgi:hypothetical protein